MGARGPGGLRLQQWAAGGSWPRGGPHSGHPVDAPPLPAQAQYRRGLELSKQAAQLGAAAGGAGEAGGTGLPELVAFASTQRAFQAKLTHFYMAAERQRTDLETLLHLHRFCKKVSLRPGLHPPVLGLGEWWGPGA